MAAPARADAPLRPDDLARAVAAAAERLGAHVVRTPLVPCPWLAEATGADVRLKLENVQRTGSFKLRGALHALLCLPPATRGVVCASSGNHGLGVATAARQLGLPAEVFVPEATAAAKVAAIERAGARVQRFGADCVDTERHAREVARTSGRHYVSPYNDASVIAGQGTVAVELLQQWPEVEVVYVALGGGGLIGGMAAYGRALRPELRWVAASPAASPAMDECVRQGRIVDVACQPTLSDSTAGGVEPGAITFPLCQQLVDRFVRIDEAAIAGALRAMLTEQHLLVEGAAAVAVAACLADRAGGGRRAAVVVCGGNLPLPTLRHLLDG